jgi:hypothetical protein
MTMRERIRILIYLGLLLSLIVVNSFLEYNSYTSNYKFHELSWFERRCVQASIMMEVILSPFEMLTTLFIETGNLRDRESIGSILMRFLALPFSFLLYFKTVRMQFFHYFKERFGLKK